MAILLGLAVATCRDDPTGPRRLRAYLSVAPSLPASASELAAFGLSVDSLRIVVVRPPADTAADTTVAFAANLDSIQLALPLTLQSTSELMDVTVELRGGGFVLFSGTAAVEVHAGPPQSTETPDIALTYTGPGANITNLTVTPLDSVIRLGDSLRYKVDAFASGVPVPLFYVSWSTSDETLAPINAHGVLRAPNARGTVTVTARTPTNVTGSTGVTFVPVPTAIAAVLPIPSNVPPGAPIAALKALVTASDGLGVQGAPVHFQAVSGGGAVTTADVVTDSAGFAQTAATAGLTGTSVYAATTAGVAGSAIFNVTIAASGATQLAFTAPPTSGFAGIALPPVIVAVEDAQGQPVVTSSNQVTIALGANPGGATLSGTTTVASAEGLAIFSDLVINNAAQGYTLVATATGLTSATSPPFDVLAGFGGKLWTNAAGGNWNNPANWSGGVVPGPTDTVYVTLPGDYTITLDVDATVAYLFVGAGSGVQTLSVTSHALAADSGMALIGTAQLLLTNATLSGSGALSTSAGTIVTQVNGVVGMPVLIGGIWNVDGAASPRIDAALAITAGALLRIASTGTCCQTTFIVQDPISNGGRIELTSDANFQSTLTVTNGGVFNQVGATLAALPGAGGIRYMNGELSNSGLVDVQTQFEVSRSGAQDVNSGTIHISGGPMEMSLNGGGSLITGGEILIDAGQALVLSGGGLDYQGGSIVGLGSLNLSNMTLTLGQAFTHDTLSLGLSNTTVNGTGPLTVAAGRTLTMVNGALNVPVAVNGTLQVDGASGPAINGAITLPASGTLRVTSSGTCCQTTLTMADGFTNNGVIELTSAANFPTTLNVTNGTLVNASGASIAALPGAGGLRSLNVALDNQGTLQVDAALDMNRTASAITVPLGGQVLVASGDLAITQSGTGATLTVSEGAVNIAAGRTLSVTGGALVYGGEGGGFQGPGTLALANVTVDLQRGISQGAPNITLDNTVINGTSSVDIPAGQTLTMFNGAVNTAIFIEGTLNVDGASNPSLGGAVNIATTGTLRVTTSGVCCQTTLNIATGFTNNGVIELTSAADFPTLLNVTTGSLVNASGATIEALPGAGGLRTLGTQIDNQGTIVAGTALTISKSGAAHLNSGTLQVADGDVTLTLAGGASLTTTGQITIGAGRALAVNGGALNYNGGGIGGTGTLALTNVVWSLTPSFSNDTLGVSLSGTTVNGTGTLTAATGRTLTMFNGAINAPLAINGTLEVDGASNPAIAGALALPAGGTLRITSSGTCCQTTLNVASGFTNQGAIELTSAANFPTTLRVTAGTLVNAPGATIAALAGAGGLRTVDAMLNNQSAVVIAAPFTLGGASADHVNAGAIHVTGGDLLIQQSGTTPTFTNQGVLDIAPGRVVTVAGGVFTNAATGTLSGSGTFDVSGASGSSFNQNGSINPGGSPGALQITGSLVSSPSSVLNVEIGGTLPTQYDQIIVSGAAPIDGTLNVTLVNGFVPAVGNSFTILSAGSRSGTFTGGLNLPTVAGGVWLPTLDGTSIKLDLLSASALAPVEWINGGSGNWSGPGNWSTGVVPGPGDSVIIGSVAHPGTFTVTLDVAATIGFLDLGGPIGAGSQTLQVSTPTITLSVGGLVAQTGVINLAGGIIAGGGTIVDSGAMNWSSGQLVGAGILQVAAGGVLNMPTTGLKTINAKTIQNAGTIAWADGNISSGAGAAVVNQAGGLIDAQGNASFLYNLGGAQPRITNQAGATFRRSVGVGAIGIEVPFDNAGVVDVQTGSLTLRAGGISTSDYAVAGGATLDLAVGAPVFANGSDVTGAGTTRITGAAVAFDASDTTQIPKLVVLSGSLQGVGVVAITDSLVWSGGTLLGTVGGGVTHIPVGADLVIGGAVTLNGRTIVNDGTVLWSGTANITSGSGAQLVNRGGAVLDVQGNASWLYNLGGAVPHVVVQPGGQLRRSVGTGTLDIRAAVDNDGTVDVQTGTLSLSGGGTSNGAFTVALPATLLWNGGAMALGASSGLTGSGTVTFASGVTTVGGAYDVTGVTSVAGGTAAFSATDTSRVTALNLSGGTLGGTGVVLVRGSGTWSGGTLADAGVLRVPAGVTLSITSAVTMNGHAIANAGQVLWTGGNISSGSGAVVSNSGLFDVRADASLNYNLGGAAPVFTNTGVGTLRRSNGLGTAAFHVALTNAGLVDVQTGVLQLQAGGSTTGTQNTAAAATLLYAAGTHSWGTGAAFTGAGRVIIDGAVTVHVDAVSPDTVEANWIELASGTLGGLGVLRMKDSLVWTGGALSDAGVLQIPAGARLAIRGGGTRSLSNHQIANAGVVSWMDATTINSGSDASLRIESGAVFQAEADANWNYNLGGAVPHIDNLAGGLIKRGVATSAITVATALNNDGTVDLQTGSVTFTNGGNAKGSATVSAGATLGFGGGTHTWSSGSITGAGNVAVSGAFTLGGAYNVTGVTQILGTGVATLNTTDTTRISTLDQQGAAVLTGIAPVVLRTGGNLAGGTISGTGGFRIPAGVTLAVTGTGVKTLSRVFDVLGVIDVTGSGTMSGTGTLNVANGAQIVIEGDPNWSSGATVNLAAGALLKRSTSTGTAVVTPVVNNNGTVDVSSGTLQLNGGGAGIGTYLASNTAATLEFSSGTHTVTDGKVNGSGIVKLSGGGFTIGGSKSSYDVLGTTLVTGGTHTFNTPDTTRTNVLQMQGGTITGSAHMLVRGDQGNGGQWTAGTIMAPTGLPGAVVLRIPINVTFDITSAATHQLVRRSFVNFGTTRWQGGNIASTDALFDNRPSATLQASALNSWSGSGSAAIQNQNRANIFMTATGSTTMGPGIRLDNAGAFDIAAGTNVKFTGTFNNQTGGDLQGNGTLDVGTAAGVTNTGNVRPGGTGAIGVLTVIAPASGWPQSTGSTLWIDVTGLIIATQTDQFAVNGLLITGPATGGQGGSLQLVGNGIFVPSGTVGPIVTFGQRTGTTFSTTISGGLPFPQLIQYLTNALNILW